MTGGGYEATMLLAQERPDLLPLVRLVLEMGDEAFDAGLQELVRRGLLVRYDIPAQWEAV